jgi:protoporphyrinogen oxidase
MTNGLKIGIIGAGAAGMAAAWDLVRAGHQVTVFEAGNEVGGLAAGFKDDQWEWALEKFYHHWFQSDKDVLTLIEEIGHSDKVMFPRPKTSYWLDGKVYRSEINLSALQLPLSWLAKIRLGLFGAYLKLTPLWKPLEKVTAHEWLQRTMGTEVYNKLWRPLFIGKFSDEFDKINMAWFWARIHSRTLRLGMFKGGFQAFLESLANAIRGKGADVRLNAPIEQITTQDGKPALKVNGELCVFDRVISTLSPSMMLRLTDGLADTAYGKKMTELRSIGAVCVVLALKQPLLSDGTYWLNLPATSPDKKVSQFPFLALVEHTNFMDKAHYGGDNLVYCGDYVPADHEYFKMKDDEMVERFAKALPTFNAAFKQDWIRKAWVFRAPYAQPVPQVNHSEKILPLKTPIAGLYWASMSQVYPWDRGTNYAVEIGRRVARLAMEG